MTRLVPITRELLAEFYQQHPFDPVPDAKCAAHLEGLARLQKNCCSSSPQAIATMTHAVHMPVPHRLDDCFWRTRQYCEEAAHSCEQVAQNNPKVDNAAQTALRECAQRLLATNRHILSVQTSNTEAAATQVKRFMPQDFRGALVEAKRSSTEARFKKQVDDLVARGGSIRDRYELYLKQQWERREAVVQMGNLSGVFKLLVKYLGGVPQVLLDFAKEINAPLGPMEEQRLKYGPEFYKLCELGNAINVATAIWAAAPTATSPEAVADAEVHGRGALGERAAAGEGAGDDAAVQRQASEASEPGVVVLKLAVEFYCAHLQRLTTFLGELFIISPFFVTEDTVAKRRTSIAGSHVSARQSLELSSVHIIAAGGAPPSGGSPTAHYVNGGGGVGGVGGAARGVTSDGDVSVAGEVHCADALLAVVGLHSGGGGGHHHQHAQDDDDEEEDHLHYPNHQQQRSVNTTNASTLFDTDSKAAAKPELLLRPEQEARVGLIKPSGVPGVAMGSRSVFSSSEAQEGIPAAAVATATAGLLQRPSAHAADQTLGARMSVGSTNDYASCCDNMSWVSGTLYQLSVGGLHGELDHMVAVGCSHSRRSTGAGVGRRSLGRSSGGGVGGDRGLQVRLSGGAAAAPVSGGSGATTTALPAIASAVVLVVDDDHDMRTGSGAGGVEAVAAQQNGPRLTDKQTTSNKLAGAPLRPAQRAWWQCACFGPQLAT